MTGNEFECLNGEKIPHDYTIVRNIGWRLV